MTAHDRPHTAVCDPTGAPNAPPKQLAPRLQSLRGARVALLDNGKEFSDDVINAIRHSHSSTSLASRRCGYGTNSFRLRARRSCRNSRARAMPSSRASGH